ncbi:MATE family efflux transporter [Lachnospiraceae bacterium ZAX-1]
MTIPASIEYVLQAALSYADFIMVGRIGKNATAAIGLTQEVTFLLKGVLMAAGIGIVSCISVAVGRQDDKKVKRTSIQAFFLSIAIGIFLLVVALLISSRLPLWLGADKSILADASMYFRIIFIPAIFTSFNMLLASVLRGVGDMKTPMFVNVVITICNIVFNFLFIYESRVITILGFKLHVWGAGLFVAGSAIGTAIASVIGGLLMIAGVLKNPLVSPLQEPFKLDIKILKEFVVIAVPVFFLRITTSFGRVVFTSFVARLGTVIFAAHTIAFTAESVFYMAVVGMQASVTTLAGNYKGEGSKRKLDQLTKTSTWLIAIVMFVVGVVMFVSTRLVISLFTSDTEVIKIAATLFAIVAINEPIFGISMVMEGIFNGTGNTKSPFIVQTATLWFVRVFGTWLTIYVFGLGIYGAWICMVAENAARGIALSIRYHFVKSRLVAKEDISGN